MTDFLLAMGPIVFLWSVPLLPLFFTAIAATVEAALTLGRRQRQTLA